MSEFYPQLSLTGCDSCLESGTMKHGLCLQLRQGDALSGSQVLVEVTAIICFLTSFAVLEWAGGDWNHGLGVGDDACSLAVIQQRSGAPNSTVFRVYISFHPSS